MINIEKGIPTPLGNGKNQDLLRKMKVGDSVLVGDRNVATCIHSAARSLGFRVTIRKQPNGEIRVWKVAK